MFRNLPPTTPDLILSLMLRCRQDGRADKIDLSVGVYRTDDGNTPIMAAAREAERQVIAEQTTKVYVGPLGDAAFNAAATDLVLGSGFGATRVCTAQTPGGSGALRMIAELLKAANPEAVIHVPDPTWANHTPLLTSCGLPTTPYAYYDAKTGGVLFDAMLSDLARAKSGDIVLLHGCCHNPTGADLTQPQWAELAVLMLKRGLFPLVDLAYQGLGEGLEQDAAGLRLLAGIVPELAVAFSGSKNFRSTANGSAPPSSWRPRRNRAALRWRAWGRSRARFIRCRRRMAPLSSPVFWKTPRSGPIGWANSTSCVSGWRNCGSSWRRRCCGVPVGGISAF